VKLELFREFFTEKSTVGKLSVDGQFECLILEDRCREDVPGTWTPALKIKGQTAIPYGIYPVVISFSQRFGRVLPLLMNVPDFTGIRIHPGNAPKDTEGCLLPGITRDTDFVGNSLAAFGQLYRKIHAAMEREKITIEILRAVLKGE